MNDTNIDTQSESILIQQAQRFKAADACVLRINRQYHPLVWTLILLSFIVIILVVNRPLFMFQHVSWYSHERTVENDTEENKLLNKFIILVLFAHKKYSRSFIKN